MAARSKDPRPTLTAYGAPLFFDAKRDMDFPGSFWRRLLKLVDAELETEASMVVIGGAAIALEYANRHLTRDLDTSTAIEGDLLEAVERARKSIQAEEELEDPPPVAAAGIFDSRGVRGALPARPDRGRTPSPRLRSGSPRSRPHEDRPR
jgi:hypothetical protein